MKNNFLQINIKLLVMLFAVHTIPSYALHNNDSDKLSLIKDIYAEAIGIAKYSGNIAERETLYKYANDDLQNAIALSIADVNNYDYSQGESSSCQEAGYAFKLVDSHTNGMSIDEFNYIDYRIIKMET